MSTPQFIKYYPGLSYLFSPVESRFLLHMVEIEFIRSQGYRTDWSRAEFIKRMDLSEYAFDKCVARFEKLGLLEKSYNNLGNRVYYRWNKESYERLVIICSSTRNIDRLKQFFKKVFELGGKKILEVSDEEIQDLKG